MNDLTRVVAKLVAERVPEAGADVIEVVVREVVAAMSGAAAVPPHSTPAPPAEAPAHNSDGTVTTPRATFPEPAGSFALEICGTCLERERAARGNRAVVTTTGRNRHGLLAAIATEIASTGGDIQDVSQTIVSGFFTMIMLVDVGSLTVPFSEFKQRLVATSGQLGIHAVVVHEEVMQALQRV